MRTYFFISLLLITLPSCAQSPSTPIQDSSGVFRTTAGTVETRFVVPDGFRRPIAPTGSYTEYLRTFPLKRHETPVKLYTGAEKPNQEAHAAILDIDVGKKDLQQCADAVMRLRAEYLYQTKQYVKIHFNLTNGFRAEYSRWMKGYRIEVQGNTTTWVSKTTPSNSYADFKAFLEFVFTYAGTLSLSKELIPISIDNIAPGDVFISGGSPGHAVIVMDIAENPDSGEKLFILAQSYMPAQDIHILINENDPKISPWYSTDFSGELITPEWTFTKDQLMRFGDE